MRFIFFIQCICLFLISYVATVKKSDMNSVTHYTASTRLYQSSTDSNTITEKPIVQWELPLVVTIAALLILTLILMCIVFHYCTKYEYCCIGQRNGTMPAMSFINQAYGIVCTVQAQSSQEPEIKNWDKRQRSNESCPNTTILLTGESPSKNFQTNVSDDVFQTKQKNRDATDDPLQKRKIIPDIRFSTSIYSDSSTCPQEQMIGHQVYPLQNQSQHVPFPEYGHAGYKSQFMSMEAPKIIPEIIISGVWGDESEPLHQTKIDLFDPYSTDVKTSCSYDDMF